MKFFGAIALLLCIACTQASYFRGKNVAEPEKEKEDAKDAPPAEEAEQEPEGGKPPPGMECMQTCKPIDKEVAKSVKCTTWGAYAAAGGCAEKCPAGMKAMINKTLCEEPPPLKGPAHSDNFQDELVDQADPEFKMLDADGDGCVTVAETNDVMRQQMQQGAPDVSLMSEKEKKQMKQMMDHMQERSKQMFAFVDKNKDECIDRTEFKAAQEMEGPPPGYQTHMEEEMGEEEFEEQMEEDEKAEFDFMDRSGDGKISKPEIYNYADKNMPHADISKEKVDEMFDSADTDKDGFLTFDEFSDAGKNYEGDGNEMENAEPMGGEDNVLEDFAEPQEGADEGAEQKQGEDGGAEPADEEAEAEAEEKDAEAKDTALHQKKHRKKAHGEPMSLKIIRGREKSLRAGVKEHMLAQKTPLKVMAKLFGGMAESRLRRNVAQETDDAGLDGDEKEEYQQAEIAEEEEELNKEEED